jgi:thiazole/oxazole-forming peptide maturase SagD family component
VVSKSTATVAMLETPTISPLDLRFGADNDLLAAVCKRASPAIAAVARRFARAFFVGSVFAPGLAMVGAEIALDQWEESIYGAARASTTGTGERRETALTSCLAEACEFLSQFERPGDVLPAGRARNTSSLLAVVDGWIADSLAQAQGPIEWVRARNASSNAVVLLPADLCLRRPTGSRSITPPVPLSTGTAAGVDFAAAATRAIFELCERDAAAMWWLGGRRAREFAPDDEVTQSAADYIQRLRQGTTGRTSWVLDISSDTNIPVVAAVSVDDSGRGLACGLAARFTAVDAAHAAILEMCQMELAAPMARAKRAERGDDALNHADRRHLRRAAAFVADCEALHPIGFSNLSRSHLEFDRFDLVVRHLDERDIAVYLLDLQRADLGVSVVRAIAPSLQPFSLSIATQRFSRQRRMGAGHSLGEHIPLL